MSRPAVAREKILTILRGSKKHLSVAGVLQLLKARHITIGIATAYRALNSLVAEGLVQKHVFENDEAFFEITPTQHHDHLICERCGGIEEFINPTIESLQEAVAKKHGFQLLSHRLELFGICQKCQ